jgi:hypothetical protein
MISFDLDKNQSAPENGVGRLVLAQHHRLCDLPAGTAALAAKSHVILQGVLLGAPDLFRLRFLALLGLRP